ncbi:alpha/beta hydrolase [Salegentibacter sp. JZCK2]|uniref:alpha/beta hydrolase n=1 Tax=Salegentibacter tibetensis TaxID=2873600 RepID=UPI001CCCE0FC|nr:alpha/beta fold hydrolase [Salegentibacter tibetensis]MBZ9728720.1 alpha/beta hydrolase [Salegentibacter tibetensis]
MRTGIIFLSVLTGFYILICLLLYVFQEKMIFLPQVLGKDFKFSFRENFEERFIEMGDGKKLNALLFKAENSQGVIFYLHGNAGSLEDWGSVAETFMNLDYDLFIPDYRGYGKSEGNIKNEEQLHQDIQILYEHLKLDYSENKIIVLGHSIGSGMAAKVAAANNPRLLILQAPMYSLPDLVKNTPPFNIFPRFLIRYKFSTGNYLKEAEIPVAVLHGDEDEIIYYGSSLKLQQEFKSQDTLITLEGYGHNNFLGTEPYRREIEEVLKRY